MNIVRRFVASLTLLVVGVLSLAGSAFAASSSDISGVSQTYNADPAVQVGMIVQLKPKDAKTVIPLEGGNAKQMLGIVVPVGNSPIVLAPQASNKDQVLVATTGRNDILVSNQNGAIRAGDYITISALDGVGMRADQNQSQVIGRAAAGFDSKSTVIGSVDLKDTLGRKKTVALGRVALDITITHNPQYDNTSDHVPGFLNKVSTGVAGKPVSAARIYLGVVLFVVTAFIAGMLLVTGVRSGMSAVGRNPLSRKSIGKSLLQAVVAALIIFISGLFGVYLLVKL